MVIEHLPSVCQALALIFSSTQGTKRIILEWGSSPCRGVSTVYHSMWGSVNLSSCFNTWKGSELIEQILTHNGSRVTISRWFLKWLREVTSGVSVPF